MKRILIVAAHPDDEALGCGGTIAKHQNKGDEVHILLVGRGRGDSLDQKFDTLPLVYWVSLVEASVKQYKPDIIYTHCSSDINRDHRIINEAVLVATRPPSSVKELYAFDATSDWAFGQFGYFKPNVFVEIDIEEKMKGLEVYKGEMRPYPHPRSPEAIRALAMRWGSVVGVPYAEAFELVRQYKR